MEVGSSKVNPNPLLVLESAWRIPQWQLMREALAEAETNCPREFAWKVNTSIEMFRPIHG